MAQFVGKGIPRIDAKERAMGNAAFSDDLYLKDPLTLKVLRSTQPHARIRSINLEKALKIDGVAGILTSSDVPGNPLHGLIVKDQPVLAGDKVRFVGEALALVGAEDEETAKKALRAIEVEYEDLPSVYDMETALKEHAPLLHQNGNLLFRKVIKKGNVEEGFSKSRAVIKRTYRTPHLEHAYLEPDSGVGYLDEDGTLVICASTQNPHYDQKEVSEILGIEEEKVRIIQSATGGAFGSKLDLTVQGFIGLALYYFKRPVRLVYDREESFLSTVKRHPFKIEMETGAVEDGRLMALRVKCLCDTGAYASYGIAVATRAAVHATGPYEIENVEIESLAVYTNNPVAGAMRGFGVPQVAFAHESQMDLLASSLGMDPLQLRKINALRPGSVTSTGQVIGESAGILESLDAIEPYYTMAGEYWTGTDSGGSRRKGFGIGAMFYGIGNTGVQNPSSARVEIDPGGKVSVFTGAAELGQGSTTVLTQIAAEVLGIDPCDIKVVVADTKLTFNAGATSASRQTYISGNAVRDASQKLADVLITEAVDVLKTPKSRLAFENGEVLDTGDRERRVSLQKLARRAHRKGRPLSWQGYFDPETTPLDAETGRGIPYATYAFACHLAFVEVDVHTGEVEVSRIVAAHDVGKAINPLNVEGQIQGGVSMGTGFALTEEYKHGETASLGEYHIPTSLDVPVVEVIIIESAEPTGPFGAKGVGEPALIPTAPAIINAIAHAMDQRIYHLPANPERIMTTLKRRQSGLKEV